MTSDKNLYKKIISAIETTELEYNVRGRLRVALNCISLLDQKFLACDFAIHGVRLLSMDDNSRCTGAITVIKTIQQFLENVIAIEAVHSVTRVFLEAESTEIAHSENNSSITISPLGSFLRLLELCCCQRELEEIKLIYRNRYQPDAFAVAEEITNALTSKNEYEWQLQHVLEYVQKQE